jgi:hypothetical protein
MTQRCRRKRCFPAPPVCHPGAARSARGPDTPGRSTAHCRKTGFAPMSPRTWGRARRASTPRSSGASKWAQVGTYRSGPPGSGRRAAETRGAKVGPGRRRCIPRICRHRTGHRPQAPWLRGSVAQWLSGSVAQWLSGSVAQWLSGSVAQWLSGSVAQWLSGSVAQTAGCG